MFLCGGCCRKSNVGTGSLRMIHTVASTRPPAENVVCVPAVQSAASILKVHAVVGQRYTRTYESRQSVINFEVQ